MNEIVTRATSGFFFRQNQNNNKHNTKAKKKLSARGFCPMIRWPQKHVVYDHVSRSSPRALAPKLSLSLSFFSLDAHRPCILAASFLLSQPVASVVAASQNQRKTNHDGKEPHKNLERVSRIQEPCLDTQSRNLVTSNLWKFNYGGAPEAGPGIILGSIIPGCLATCEGVGLAIRGLLIALTVDMYEVGIVGGLFSRSTFGKTSWISWAVFAKYTKRCKSGAVAVYSVSRKIGPSKRGTLLGVQLPSEIAHGILDQAVILRRFLSRIVTSTSIISLALISPFELLDRALPITGGWFVSSCEYGPIMVAISFL